MAKYLGFIIYVTVGTEAKRRLIKEQYDIPDGHIFHSRDASFVKVSLPYDIGSLLSNLYGTY